MMGTFQLKLEAFARKANARADKIVRKIVLDVGTSLVIKSPVGDADHWATPPTVGYVGGRFRGNWQYGNVMPDGAINTIDPTGSKTTGKISSSIAPNAAGKLHYLVNRLPYGPRLEMGWSKQAPFGMVGLTVREFQPIVARAAAAIKQQIK